MTVSTVRPDVTVDIIVLQLSGQLSSRTGNRNGAGYDPNKVDEVVLALLWLTAFDEDQFGARAWKSHDWYALERPHAAGYISDPRSKAKSVVLSPAGVRRARGLFEQHFSRKRRLLGKRERDTIPKPAA